jgi:oligoendopeptidase F
MSLAAEDVRWDLTDLVRDRSFDELLDAADALSDELAQERGHVAAFDTERLLSYMTRTAELHDLLGRAGSWAQLQFSADMRDQANGARMQRYQERATAIGTKLIWFDLEWAALDDGAVDALLADDRLHFCRHYLLDLRKHRPYLLSEPRRSSSPRRP